MLFLQVIERLIYLKIEHRMTIIVSIHQPNQRLLDMFDNIYVLAKGGVNVYSGHPNDLKTYLLNCGINCQNELPIEALIKYIYCQTSTDENHEYLKLDNIQNKNRLVNRIGEEGLIDHDTLRTYHKRFYLIDLWTLLKRTITNTYLGNWKILFLQFILYQTLGVILRVHYTGSHITEPDGCLDIGYRDITKNCNQTQEDLDNEFILKQNFKYLYVVTAAPSLFLLVFVIVPFMEEIKVIENEYYNCK